MKFPTMVVLVLIGCTSPSRGKADQSRIQTTPADCGAAADQTITDSSVGAIAVRARVEAVQRQCTILRDSTVDDAEAIPHRELEVAFAGDTLAIVVDSGLVRNIEIRSARLRTSDSLAVGIPISRLFAAGIAAGNEGEDELYVTATLHCGLSFLLDYVVPANKHRRVWSDADLHSIPADTRVRAINIFGCAQRP